MRFRNDYLAQPEDHALDACDGLECILCLLSAELECLPKRIYILYTALTVCDAKLLLLEIFLKKLQALVSLVIIDSTADEL
jgi:hypothetical protein